MQAINSSKFQLLVRNNVNGCHLAFNRDNAIDQELVLAARDYGRNEDVKALLELIVIRIYRWKKNSNEIPWQSLSRKLL
jgi:hypothetical protein